MAGVLWCDCAGLDRNQLASTRERKVPAFGQALFTFGEPIFLAGSKPVARYALALLEPGFHYLEIHQHDLGVVLDFDALT